jgi:hypothetical protein
MRRTTNVGKKGEIDMRTKAKTAKALLSAAAFMLVSTAAEADPLIMSFPQVTLVVNNQVDCPGSFEKCLSPNLSLSTEVLTSFASVSTTGDGFAFASAPQFASFNGLSFTLNPNVQPPNCCGPAILGSIGTTGPGSATANFGATVLVEITNISSNDITVRVSGSIDQLGAIAAANPLLGERMTINAELGVTPTDFGLGLAIESLVCDSTTPFPMSNPNCHAQMDFGPSFGDSELVAPGQTASWEMIILENWSVSEVPEPASLMLFASVLGLGFFAARTRSSAS